MTGIATTTDMDTFDVCGDLPTGTTLLEASAGTGKTFTIAALAARIVAEGHADLSRLMLVTFSRAATAELRDRVRERFVVTERALADRDTALAHHDTVIQLLANADPAEVAVRRERLGRALAQFDAATISTTHGFCQQMLAGLGIAADTDPAATLTERLDELAREVVDDLYLRKYALNGGDPQLLRHDAARAIGLAATRDVFSRLEPADAVPGSAAADRHGLAGATRREVQRRKRDRHLFTYDDLLQQLHAALTDPVTGALAVARIRSRFDWVLVDEFQDTDPVQWAILERAFVDGGTNVVLIGDPKQAIYAFRGADVFAYLEAYEQARVRRTLGRNWRSDAALLQALDHVYGGVALGDVRIRVRPVDAVHGDRRLHGAPVDAPLRLRHLQNSHFNGHDKRPSVHPVRAVVARDCARDIARLLASGATLDLPQRRTPAVQPGDVAVLVRSHSTAAMLRAELRTLGIPAVLTGAQSVFATPPARDWLTFLRALEQPHRAGLARAAALTSFLGWTAAQLAAAGDDELDALGLQLRQWRDVLAQRGVAALLEVVTTETELTARLLAGVNGERDLTDLRHVGQALHAAARAEGLGPTALVEWLQEQTAQAEGDKTEERARRLESDADAVQIATVWTSKGLEYPIVYVPFAWDTGGGGRAPEHWSFHDDAGERVLFVGGSGSPQLDEAKERCGREQAGEELRLLYVALTRAQCQVVTWWAPSYNSTSGSGLNRLLFDPAGRAAGAVEQSVTPPPERRAVERLEAWAAEAAPGLVSLERVDVDEPAPRWTGEAAGTATLAAATFDRTLDSAWRRTSYSALTAAAHDHRDAAGGAGDGVGSEPETEERQDEPPVDVQPADDDDAALRAVPSPMAELPTGAAFGTVVHQVFETVDTSIGADALPGELETRCREALASRLATQVEPDALRDALLPVLRTPLGPLAGGRALADIPTRDRLSELDFELPLLGGDTPRDATASVRGIAALLCRHLPADDPLAGYADALDVPDLGRQLLRGYLTGSIDAVLRVRDDGVPRYLVVDYKTNWLGGFGPDGPEPLTAWDYRPAALVRAMVGAHYPLQALLYSVALHRYLRWRQPAYDPAVHLGGVLYLFVRGMCGPATPVVDGVPTGVFSWQPPAALVEDLSRLLDRGTRGAGAGSGPPAPAASGGLR